MIRKSHLGAVLAMLALAACSTNIHPRDETIVRSKVPLGSFTNVVIKPLSTDHSDGDSGDMTAIVKINGLLSACMLSVFKRASTDIRDGKYPPGTLIVEPRIEDITKKTVGERIMLGPLSGSSAVLLKTTYTNADTNDVVAKPEFFAKANAWGGAFTFGSTDNLIMNRVAHNACDYAKDNL